MPSTPTHFTPFQQTIIDHLIARQEGGTPPEYLFDYFQAFEGGFDRDRRFTLHSPNRNKLCLYHNSFDVETLYMKRELFTGMCGEIKKGLFDIAQFIIFLIDNELVIPEDKQESRFELSQEQAKYWRRYQEFFPSEAAPILFVKSILPIPTDKLYELWAETRLIKSR